jgi:hypothetical protein
MTSDRRTDDGDGDTSTTRPPEAWTQVAQRHYDPDEGDVLTVVIVNAIADGRGTEPTEVKEPPLYEVVDAAALEATFFGRNRDDTDRQGTGTVEFRYAEFLVKVRSDGWVQVYEAAATSRDVDA